MMSLGLPGKGDTGSVWCWNHIYTLCSDSTSENVFSFLQVGKLPPLSNLTLLHHPRELVNNEYRERDVGRRGRCLDAIETTDLIAS